MNILFLLLPKKDVDYLFEDFTIRQALEKMKAHGYSTVPVIERSTGKYLRSVTDGDFLRVMLDNRLDFDDLERLPLSSVPSGRIIKAVSSYAREKDLLDVMINQNYVPVVDDNGSFIGIVTRKSVLTKYISDKEQ
ncbi:MAG: CBS domain-containing protein [Bacillota bacterium]|nr:CBS domain-containing protein [Bacillota bacterium]